MTRNSTPSSSVSLHETDEHSRVEHADDLPGVAARLADEVKALVPACTAAIALEVGSRWQLLAQCGAVDVTSDWRGTLAASTAGGEGLRRGDGYAVSIIPGASARALLILVAETEVGALPRVHEGVSVLLADGGRELEAARATQQRDRAARRIELLSRPLPDVRPSRVTDRLEDTLAHLWPHAAVRFHDLGASKDSPSSLRRLAQSAYDLDHPAIDDARGATRLLPPDLTYRVAIPYRSRRGALIVDVRANGETLDRESVAVAHALSRAAELRDREHALTTEIRTLRREDPETGCAPGDVLTAHLEQALRDNTRGDSAILLVEVDPASAGNELERASVVGEALADAVRRERAEIFRVQPWRYAVVLAGSSAREARLVAQRLHLAVRHAAADGLGCSASIGVALAPVNGAEASELIDAAEQAMHTTAAIAGDTHLATSRGRRSARPSDVFRRVEALRTLTRLADEGFHEGHAYSDAVATRAVRIATAMHLSVEVVQAIQLAGELCEVGSLLIRDDPQHPSLPSGVLGLDSVAATASERLLQACGFREAAAIVASVDEHYDGTGTPGARSGDAIPIGARILAVARDVETTLEGRQLDASALGTACARLEAHSSRAFDPYIVQIAIRTAEPHRAGRVPLPE
jgi:GGDEF domain-containing protein